MPVLRQLARLASGRGRNHPNIARNAIRFHFRRSHRVDGRMPIGRNLRLAHPLHAHQVVERHRMLRWNLRPQSGYARERYTHK